MASARAMLERVEARYTLKPARLIGDTVYGTASMLGWLVDENHIEPHVAVWDKTDTKANRYSRWDSTREAENNRYLCPADKPLHNLRRNLRKQPSGITKDNTVIIAPA